VCVNLVHHPPHGPHLNNTAGLLVKMKKFISIVLLGDSDISRWPPSLYPECRNVHTSVINYGQSGAILSDLLLQLQKWRIERQDMYNSCDVTNVFVVCAGENDLGLRRSIDSLLDTLRSFLDELFPNSQLQQIQQSTPKSYLLFLGPKFEPWLTDDISNRKQYVKLSNALNRTIHKHPGFCNNQMIFIDCVTMFCTRETSSIPGAVYGGKALPKTEYFDRDGLHLSEEGYRIWKGTIETELNRISSRDTN